jgi:hypothetical protein
MQVSVELASSPEHEMLYCLQKIAVATGIFGKSSLNRQNTEIKCLTMSSSLREEVDILRYNANPPLIFLKCTTQALTRR